MKCIIHVPPSSLHLAHVLDVCVDVDVCVSVSVLSVWLWFWQTFALCHASRNMQEWAWNQGQAWKTV